jgi:hypothetical protein
VGISFSRRALLHGVSRSVSPDSIKKAVFHFHADIIFVLCV